jgi:hypothetical protein
MTQPDVKDVRVINWDGAPKSAEPICAKKTTLRTLILDPTSATGPASYPITSYEPHRLRLAILVIDAACAITSESPNLPDAGTTITTSPQGGYLPASVNVWHEFFGPDEFWLKALTGNPTRVTIIKEYQ